MAAFQRVALFVTVVVSQPNTICIWDSTGDQWDRYNGEYAKQSTKWNGEAWYQQIAANANCPTSDTTVLYAGNYGEDIYWQVNTQRTTNWAHSYPDCEDKNIADPTSCSSNQWAIYNAAEAKIGTMTWTVTAGNCPTLSCGRIQVTSSGIAQCNRIFTKDFSEDYVYTFDTGTLIRYLYFNPWTFKWYCSNADGHLDCDDDANIVHQKWASSSDGWTDTSIGSSFNLAVSTGNTATFTCLDTLDPTMNPTPAPTISPTLAPTKSPTTPPTLAPTISPTQPTMNPTQSPTQSTISPTLAPTQSPTRAPSKAPTTPPTVAPTDDPTLAPTISPTAPTQPPTMSPTNAPTYSPTRAPTHPPTSSPTSAPTQPPTLSPTKAPTYSPTKAPTQRPTRSPTGRPTQPPTSAPTQPPTRSPTTSPTQPPTSAPTQPPTRAPTIAPTQPPTTSPTNAPTFSPTLAPSVAPTVSPSMPPTKTPSMSPTVEPTRSPTAAPTFTWNICDVELRTQCPYVAYITFDIDWNAADYFFSYLSSVSEMEHILYQIIESELRVFIKLRNMVITVVLHGITDAAIETHAELTNMVGTDNHESVDSLVYEIDTTDNMIDRISRTLEGIMQSEFPQSKFELVSIVGEIEVIRSQSPTTEKRSATGTVLVILAVFCLCGVLIFGAWIFYMRRDEIRQVLNDSKVVHLTHMSPKLKPIPASDLLDSANNLQAIGEREDSSEGSGIRSGDPMFVTPQFPPGAVMQDAFSMSGPDLPENSVRDDDVDENATVYTIE